MNIPAPSARLVARVDSVTKSFGVGSSTVTALDSVSLGIRAGEFTAVSVDSMDACGLRPDGELTCWSWFSSEPPLEWDRRYLAVDLPCAVTIDGSLECDARTLSESGSLL